MVRKTKHETEQTRLQIIAAARTVFAKHGVSRTTLALIAKEANLTRGAIYWHFKNKPDLFFAMMEQISLPLVDRIDGVMPADNPGDPLQGLRAGMSEILRLLQEDPVARTTFEIVTLKCEYVSEFTSLESRVMKTGCAFVQRATRAYQQAQEKGLLRKGIDPAQYALESYTFMKGLIHLWLSDSDGSLIRGQAQSLIDAHIAMRYK
jgi:TetR/AcrR family acrAB operon transcriptional repressor